jgi:hypothetical protein
VPAFESLRSVVATRYVLPLREGGSLPGLMEADDLGTYVVKFRGAGQGRKALVAEVVVAALARAVGFRVPELVLVDVDPEIAKAEPDEEVQDLLKASAGTNLGIDYLPGSLGFDPVADALDPTEAARLVWFDAFTQNVDRSWRNPNLLRWHGDLWLIDHGAALYFHHSWRKRADAAGKPYPNADDHVLIAAAGSVAEAGKSMAQTLGAQTLQAAVAGVPEQWLADEPGFDSPDAVRAAYVEVLSARLAARDVWTPAVEAARARV